VYLIAWWLLYIINQYKISSFWIRNRCSCLSNCTVQLENDGPQAKQWGDGKLQFLYNCIPG
jgi:hypothetical protein